MLQIYYDFSGYSDMAIGMAKIFGFEFNENFNHPYSAKGIKDFSSILKVVEEKAPIHKNVTTTQIGNVATFLLSNMSDSITGQVIYADNGYNIMGV